MASLRCCKLKNYEDIASSNRPLVMTKGRNSEINESSDVCYILRESQTTQNVLWSPVSVCLSTAACQHYCMDPDVT